MKKVIMGLAVVVLVLGVWVTAWGYRVTIMDDSGQMRTYEVHEDGSGGANIWNMDTGKLYNSRRQGSGRYYLDMDTGKSFTVRPGLSVRGCADYYSGVGVRAQRKIAGTKLAFPHNLQKPKLCGSI